MDSPCNGCGDRQVGCHGGCERYKAYKAVLDERNRKVHDAKARYEEASSFIIERVRYANKRSRKKRK